MSGPFEPLGDLGLDLDDAVVCEDGICTIPLPPDPVQSDPEPSDRY